MNWLRISSLWIDPDAYPPGLLSWWMSRLHREMTFHLTRPLMTEHGCFNRYLHRIGGAPSIGCAHCWPTQVVRRITSHSFPMKNSTVIGSASTWISALWADKSNVGEPSQPKSSSRRTWWPPRRKRSSRDSPGRRLPYHGKRDVKDEGGMLPDDYAAPATA